MLLILLSISLCFSLVSPETNSRTIKYTIVSGEQDFPEVTVVAMVNGIQTGYFDSDTRRCVPRQQFLADSLSMKFWDDATDQAITHTGLAKENLKSIMKRTNQTSGIHTLQWIHSVEVSEDGSVKRSMRFGFDGKDHISLEPDRMRWVAANHFAAINKEKWNSDQSWNYYWESYLQKTSVEHLNRYLEVGKDYFIRKVQPEVFISRREPNGQDKPLTLSCLVTGFYPVDIEVTWLRNGEVMSETHSSGVRPNHDGTHQVQKEIEVNAGDEDQYSCQIEHSSLTEAQLYQWEVPGKSAGHSHLEMLGFMITPLAIIVGIIGLVMWKRTQRDKPGNLQQQCHGKSGEEHQTVSTQPFLETGPTLHQQEAMDNKVELELIESHTFLKSESVQRDSEPET